MHGVSSSIVATVWQLNCYDRRSREQKAREGKNPQTGERMQIEARKVPAFKAGKALKESV
jgi:hypothetical protein